MSKDYSLPDCPRVGKYDGLGMAAVPLAIRDKERERGGFTNSYPKEGSYTFEEYNKEAERSYKSGYKAGRKSARKQAYQEGYEQGKIEVYKKILELEEYSQVDWFHDLYYEAYGFAGWRK